MHRNMFRVIPRVERKLQVTGCVRVCVCKKRAGRREKGEGRREKGEGRREKGEGRREKGGKGEGRRAKGEGVGGLLRCDTNV